MRELLAAVVVGAAVMVGLTAGCTSAAGSDTSSSPGSSVGSVPEIGRSTPSQSAHAGSSSSVVRPVSSTAPAPSTAGTSAQVVPTSVVKLTPAGVICDLIANPNTNQSDPVAVLDGSVNCAEAMAVARDYLAGVKAGRAEGQGQFLTVDGWSCNWPYVEGRSHAESYLKCVDPSGVNAIRIGN